MSLVRTSWLLDGLEYDNPLRHSYRIMVVDIDEYDQTIADIESVPGIADGAFLARVGKQAVCVSAMCWVRCRLP